MNRREILQGLLASAAAVVVAPVGGLDIAGVIPPSGANYAALCEITRKAFLPRLSQKITSTFVYVTEEEPVRFAYMRTVDMPS